MTECSEALYAMAAGIGEALTEAAGRLSRNQPSRQ